MKHSILKSIIALTLMVAFAISGYAQEVKETPAPLEVKKKSCPFGMGHCPMMGKYKMREPRIKGFHMGWEFMGSYGGLRNEVTTKFFGKTQQMDKRCRMGLFINAGYQFNPYLYVGGGAGVEEQLRAFTPTNKLSETMPTSTSTNWIVPVYGDIRAYMLKGRISPFVQLRMGYAPSIYTFNGKNLVASSSYNGVSLGIRTFGCCGAAMHLSVGYQLRYQGASGDPANNFYGSLAGSQLEHRLTFGGTFMF